MDESTIFAIERPATNLFTYYLLSSFVLGPLFFILLIPLYFRYHTLRYRFDEEGISMRWGILFRREINLTYARIQVQTASGSAGAEMTLEGLLEFGAIRDYLYTRMRGSHDRKSSTVRIPLAGSGADAAAMQDLAHTLREVAAELRAVRQALDSRERGELP